MRGRLVACEARKLLRSTPFVLLLVAMVAFTILTVMSPADYPNPLFMTAGPQPDVVGGAIGFIGNYVDPGNVAGSAARTAFVYTPFWLAVAIVFAASAFSADFASKSVAVSQAKGMHPGRILAAKALVIIVVLGLCYAVSCLSAFLFKASQYGATLHAADVGLFLAVLGTNVLLIGALAVQAIMLYSLFKSTFVATLALLVFQVYVLLGYPSAYGLNGSGAAGNPLFTLSPVYYLMNTCALSFDNVPLLVAVVYALVAGALALAAAAAALHMKEV